MPPEFTAHPPQREHRITLPDGRVLALGEYGAADGIPVIFFAGAASSRTMNVYGDAAAVRSVRLITFDRPGLGASSPDPAKSAQSVAADLDHALARIDVHSPVAFANSQGAAFGLATAARGIFSRIALVSPADELAHPGLSALLTADVATFVNRIATDERSMREVLSSFTAESMMNFVFSGAAPSDAEVFGDDDFRRLYRTALDEGFAQGGAGYAQDTIIASTPWRIPEQSVGDVRIWFGADDTSHSPDQGEQLAQRCSAMRRVVSGVGGALAWTHTAEILDDLLA
ncbi:alpha/beta fold hydrolase [Microbacterium sp. JZ31]|uniref:alpha/beta fold hydrolase n=1 Tax=Microbacterium sp. JZ31 TaxID=1906274 RepID=UPI00193389A0|nr:alpha/beta hydrolase [Microbacterium sp. JZ31]